MEELRMETLNKIDKTINLVNDASKQFKTNEYIITRCKDIIFELKKMRYKVEFVTDEQLLEDICSHINLDHVNTILNQLLISEE